LLPPGKPLSSLCFINSLFFWDAGLLAGHANHHQVTITGTMAKDKDKDVLKPAVSR
jgi:hypothetical protein